MRILNICSVVLLLATLGLLALGLARKTAVTLPEFQRQTLTDGSQLVHCDDEAMALAFAQMGLPRPPLFSGMDPAPTYEILKRVQSWQETGASQTLGELGMIFLALGENHAAIEFLAAAQAQDPDNGWWTYYLGAACQKLSYRAEAVELFKVFAKSEHQHPVVLARLGMLQLELKNLDEALGYYQRYAKQNPNQSMAHIGVGRVLLEMSRHQEALATLRNAVALNPQDFLAYRFLGRALIAVGEEAEALEATRKAESLPQYNGWLMYDTRLEEAFALTRSQTYLNHQLQKAISNEDQERAHSLLDQLMERRPKDVDLFNNKAKLFLQQSDPKSAVAVAERGLVLYPDHFPLHLSRARALFLSKEMAEVEREIEIMARLSHNHSAVLDLQARVLFQKGAQREAISIMEQAVALDSDNTDLRLYLGIMAVGANMKSHARKSFEEVLRQDPGNKVAKAMLARIK